MCVLSSNDITEAFVVSNGVRKYGILSPILFNLNVDPLSGELNHI